MKNYRPKMFEESSRSRGPKNSALMILIFIAFMIVVLILEGIVPSFISTPELMRRMAEEGLFDISSAMNFREMYQKIMEISIETTMAPKVMIPSLFCTVFGTISAIIYCRFIEKRSLGSMGMRKEKIIPHYLRGIITGFGLMTVITLLSVLCRANSIAFSGNFSAGIILLYMFGFFIQGMSEEFIFRGYFMNSLGGKHGTAFAVIVSSAAFGLAHASNPGFGLFVFFNLTLFGVFAGLYIIAYDDIWGACAIHSVWNFVQGNFYGISVSGAVSADSVFTVSQVSGNKYLTGGTFGIEGSIFTTIVLLGGSAFMLYVISKKAKEQKA